MSELSRRNFVRLALGASAGIAFGCNKPPEAPPLITPPPASTRVPTPTMEGREPTDWSVIHTARKVYAVRGDLKGDRLKVFNQRWKKVAALIDEDIDKELLGVPFANIYLPQSTREDSVTMFKRYYPSEEQEDGNNRWFIQAPDVKGVKDIVVKARYAESGSSPIVEVDFNANLQTLMEKRFANRVEFLDGIPVVTVDNVDSVIRRLGILKNNPGRWEYMQTAASVSADPQTERRSGLIMASNRLTALDVNAKGNVHMRITPGDYSKGLY